VIELPPGLTDLSPDGLHRRALDAMKTLLGRPQPGEQEGRTETR
jgi:hypothetical protein